MTRRGERIGAWATLLGLWAGSVLAMGGCSIRPAPTPSADEVRQADWRTPDEAAYAPPPLRDWQRRGESPSYADASGLSPFDMGWYYRNLPAGKGSTADAPREGGTAAPAQSAAQSSVPAAPAKLNPRKSLADVLAAQLAATQEDEDAKRRRDTASPANSNPTAKSRR